MKKAKKKSLLELVVATRYDASGDDRPHSPAATIENIKRHRKIIAKMRKAGITGDEINFLLDLHQADAVHFQKLVTAGDAFESKKKSLN